MYILIVATLIAVTSADTLLFVPKSPDAVECLDHKYECPTGNTCCLLEDGSYGCCPLPNAVCCSDKKYCCPFGSTCLVEKASCVQGNNVFPWLQKTKATLIIKKMVPMLKIDDVSTRSDANRVLAHKNWFNKALSVSSVMCPDGKSECMDGQTCCPMTDGKYGCCPLADANCCSDHVHCCPPGFRCDLLRQECVDKIGFHMKWMNTQRPHSSAITIVNTGRTGARYLVNNVVCPDGQSECKTGQTCCKLSSGQYGCCPLPKAVCCSDGKHCCPEGTTCDVAEGKCNRGDMTLIDWFEKVPAVKGGNVVCPDGQSECQTGQTCCKLTSGQYGCCPLPKAVCCNDGKHCCPEGTTCDVAEGKCNRGDMALIDWVEKVPAVKGGNVVCPDGQSECQTGQTCCKLSSGQYGCCPLPKAVCCNDGKHCCPEGTTCDVAEGKCNRGDMTLLDWFETVPAVKGGIVQPVVKKTPSRPLKTVKCPDGQTECDDKNVCCKNTSSGGYSCCPYTDGVCCTNSKYCCPHKYVCDEEPGICRIPYTYGFINMLKTVQGMPLY